MLERARIAPEGQRWAGPGRPCWFIPEKLPSESMTLGGASVQLPSCPPPPPPPALRCTQTWAGSTMVRASDPTTAPQAHLMR